MDTPKFTSEYEDVLQNIEFSIFQEHKADTLFDANVMEALDALITNFKNVNQGENRSFRIFPIKGFWFLKPFWILASGGWVRLLMMQNRSRMIPEFVPLRRLLPA